MKSIRNWIGKTITLSTAILTTLFTTEAYTLAQDNNSEDQTDGSAEIMPLQKFDFGLPNPNADKSKIAQPIDYLKTASAEEIRQERSETTILNGNEANQAMALSEDGTEYTAGQIPYQESVTPFGGRVYNVPIMVSPLSKFPPQISLQYNSQAGNGLAGYGWDIGGLPSITIINKSLYYHGKVAPANISDKDAVYALDGVPLVQNDDESLAAEYPLETATGNIIVKKHMSGDIISHFTALYPDGSKAVFGVSSNTAAKAVYPVTHMEDNLGNQIEYEYFCTYSDYRIKSIKFKHKESTSYIGHLKFFYTGRPDHYTKFRAAQVSYQNYNLRRIESSSNGVTLCKYVLNHTVRDGVFLLKSIHCRNESGEHLRPLTFEYGNQNNNEPLGTNDFIKSDNMFLSTYFSSSSDVKFHYIRGKYLPNSYNDGLMILPAFSNYGITATKTNIFKKHYQYGSLYAAEQEVLVAQRLSYLSKVDNSITVGPGFQCINAVDVDGDGVDEIVKVNFNGTSTDSNTTTLRITVYGYDASTGSISQKKAFNIAVDGIVKDKDLVSPMQRCYHFGDFRGDGKTQLLTVSYNRDFLGTARISYGSLIDLDSACEISKTLQFQLGVNDEMFCIDVDGDGRTEVCHATTSGLKIYNLDGVAFSCTNTFADITTSILSHDNYYFLDINADGYVDIATKPVGTSTDWQVFRYTGDRFSRQDINLNGVSKDDNYLFFDVNKDGLSDLVKRNGTSVTIFLNENGTFIYDNRITSNLSFDESTKFVPCNILGYNAMSDFITIEGFNVNLYRFSQDLSSSRLLTQFTNSLGATTVNSYANMASSNYVYSIDPDRIYNNTDGYARCRFPLQLLYNTQSYLTPSLSNTEQVTDLWYTYFDACVHTKGLGFCGFGKVRTTNFRSTTNRELVTIETRNPEKMGITTRLTHGHRMTQDNPYDVTNYTYDSHTTTYRKLNPRLTKVIHTDTLSTLKSTTSYVYDAYDFPTSIKVQRTVGGSDLLTETQTFAYIHKTASDNYCVSLR